MLDNNKSHINQSYSILGEYTLLEEIGHGASGVVYLAKHPDHSEHLAVKELVLSSNIRGQIKEEIIQRFHREADLTASFSHKNIVRTFYQGKDQEKHFMVMEYLPGKTLADYLESVFPFTLKQLVNIFIQMTQGLAYAHSQGVIHRDIKPENVKILDNHHVKLMDFGMASIEATPSNLTQEGSILGTLAYMSPDQLQDAKSVTPISDLFSLGVIFYESLALQLPFKGKSTGQMILSILNEKPAPLRGLNPRVPEALEMLINSCLQKDSKQRIQSTQEVLAALIEIEKSMTDESKPIYPEPFLAPSRSKTPSESLLNIRLLHIEDDSLSQLVFQSVIEKQEIPITYHSASSVSEVQSAISNHVFDALICDYMLPDGTALDILDKFKNTPSVMTTSVVDPNIIVKLMKKGILDYIVKTSAKNDAEKALKIIVDHFDLNSP